MRFNASPDTSLETTPPSQPVMHFHARIRLLSKRKSALPEGPGVEGVHADKLIADFIVTLPIS